MLRYAVPALAAAGSAVGESIALPDGSQTFASDAFG